MVTPEMLLFLAGKMGMPNPHIHELLAGGSGVMCEDDSGKFYFIPHISDAQFGPLVVWAPTQRLSITIWEDAVLVMPKDGDEQWQEHNNTPDSIRAAAVVAICRALGYGEKE